jgi:hypothetical protein
LLVEVRYGRNNPGSIPRWSKLLVDFFKKIPLSVILGFGDFLSREKVSSS